MQVGETKMNHERYLTIKGYTRHEIVIEKSRFICTMERVGSEEEARAFIQSVRKEHYNATHNCYAYIIGEDRLHQKANDDGEPSGTAGIPMLEVLRKNHLTDIATVVTRYFGGIKLGAGGLIRAYSTAVSETLKKAQMIERKRMQVMAIKADYADIGLLEAKLDPQSIVNKTYMERVTFEVIVPVEEVEAWEAWFTDLTHAKIPYERKALKFIEVPIPFPSENEYRSNMPRN